MDLAKTRCRLPQLKHLARGGVQHGKFKDQDVLNMHFRGEWCELPLTWNAQGLGTYADGPGADRALIAVQPKPNGLPKVPSADATSARRPRQRSSSRFTSQALTHRRTKRLQVGMGMEEMDITYRIFRAWFYYHICV
jgi:hypothetical protein